MRKRGSLLAVTILAVLVVVVACGRASEEDINNALGIVPTATLSGEQIAQATEAANAAASAIAAGASPAGGAVAAIPAGDVRLGQQQFSFQCTACHQPSGQGRAPALIGPDSPVADLTDQQLFDLVRTGEGHPDQQPISTMRISDKQLASIIAYIRDQMANGG
jgi:mono/diheme cytochrome c family protein